MIDGGDGTLRFAGLARAVGVRHAVATRALGDLKADPAARARLAAAVGVAPAALVRGRQVHGANVVEVAGGGPPCVGDEAEGADALATRVPGVALVTLCADCAPVAIVDPEAGVAAVAHAGWRGAVAGIAGRAARFLVERFGAREARLRAAIGPAICAACYEVGEEVAAAARARPRGEEAVLAAGPGKARLDLEAAGVPPGAIEGAGLCTRCRPDLFFSHRATGTRERFGLALVLG